MNILSMNQYQYLTFEDILPSNEQQITEQAKFTSSPLGKAFEKLIKTIEDQGRNWKTIEEKQVKAFKDLKPKEREATKDKSNDERLAQKETFNRLLSERLNKIQKISKSIDFNNLTYIFKDSRISPRNCLGK